MLANKNTRYKSDAVVPVSSYPLERLKKLSCLADKEIHKAKLIVTISVKISKSLFETLINLLKILSYLYYYKILTKNLR